jgi:hypothetical protein
VRGRDAPCPLGIELYTLHMAFRLLDRVWDPDAPTNADWAGITPSLVTLLDGAAPLVEERVSAHANDAVWLVRRFDELSRKRLDAPARDIVALVEAARSELAREYDELCRVAGFVPADAPFACLAFAHDAGERLELFNLGDCTTLVRGRQGRLQKLGASAVRELDRQAIERLQNELAAGVEPHAARLARIRPVLLANRAHRNRLAGYDVLDVTTSCFGRFERLACLRGATRDVLLMSDGFYRLVDTFARYDDVALIDAVERRGLDALLEELRELESADPECTAHPRFKRHDDATALWVAID